VTFTSQRPTEPQRLRIFGFITAETRHSFLTFDTDDLTPSDHHYCHHCYLYPPPHFVSATMPAISQEKAQQKLAESTASVPASTTAQQSDNVAHALAGAGGGLLSMALTYMSPTSSNPHMPRYLYT
jgi:hypothetical protein